MKNFHFEAERKLGLLDDIQIYSRALRMCKWYEYNRKNKYKALIELTKRQYEI